MTTTGINFRSWVLFDGGQNLMAVHFWQVQIQKNNIRPRLVSMFSFLSQEGHGLNSVGGSKHFVRHTRFVETAFDKMRVRVIVFHKQKCNKRFAHQNPCPFVSQ